MTGKEILLATLRHKAAPRVPWVPFAGVHAGKLKGYAATEVLRDADKLVASLMEVNAQYRPDGQPVVFDLQVEAEILGCKLVWADKGPPMVASHPLASALEIPTRLPEKTDGRLPVILRAMREMKGAVGEHTALFGLVCGPFTLASHLRGSDIFMDMFDAPDQVQALIDFCARFGQRLAEYYIEAGMDVIALVDPLVSQISPEHFDGFLSGAFTRMFDDLRTRGVSSSFFVCGDATRNIEVMCRTNPDAIFIDENINMPAAKRITDRYDIAIGGNIPLSSVMLLGSQQDNMKCALDLLDAMDHRNLVIAPGCDMPYDIPAENAIGIMQAVREPERVRQMLIGYEKAAQDVDVALPDYKALEKPLIEVVTLDSATCPACTYMMHAANAAKDHFGDRIDVVEYKIVDPANIPRVQKMGIKNLPAIVINGSLAFSSLIPGKRDLIARIERVMA